MTDLPQLAPIEADYASKLDAAGVRSMEQLLHIGASRRGRQTIAMTTAISEKLVYSWVNRADMTRIDGLTHKHSVMLAQAGVSALPELATTNAVTLHLKLQALHDQGDITDELPELADIERWISAAKMLPRKVEYAMGMPAR